jgi:hypothetical protein
MPDPTSQSSDPNTQPAQSLDPNAQAGGGAPASTEHWEQGWVKNDGTFDHTRLDKAPDDIKALAKELSVYKTPGDFIKSFKEKASFASKKGIVEPLPPNATPEMVAERQALLRKVNGAPEKPEGYGLKRPDDIPEAQWNQEFADQAAKLAFENGLSPQALQGLAKLQIDMAKKAGAAQQQAEQEFLTRQDQLIREHIQKELGVSYEKAQDLAARAGRRWGVDAKSMYMKDATIFMMLARLGGLMSESKLVTGDMGNIALAGNLTPATAEAAAVDIQSNKNNPDWAAYWNQGNISAEAHEAAVEKVNSLRRLAHANRPQRGQSGT